MPSLQRFNGELMVDNRASEGPIPGIGMAGMVNLPTLSCRHCGGVWVINPDRTRAREYCRMCDKYICDGCHAVAQKSDYIHRTIDDLTEMVMSGRFTITGGSVCDPRLVRTGAK